MDKLQMLLSQARVDYKATMERFAQNEQMFYKYLFRFCEDENIREAAKAFETKDYQQATFHAHTFKGTSGNLGLVGLWEIASKLVLQLRNCSYDEAELTFFGLQSEYEKVVEIIKQIKEIVN